MKNLLTPLLLAAILLLPGCNNKNDNPPTSPDPMTFPEYYDLAKRQLDRHIRDITPDLESMGFGYGEIGGIDPVEGTEFRYFCTIDTTIPNPRLGKEYSIDLAIVAITADSVVKAVILDGAFEFFNAEVYTSILSHIGQNHILNGKNTSFTSMEYGSEHFGISTVTDYEEALCIVPEVWEETTLRTHWNTDSQNAIFVGRARINFDSSIRVIIGDLTLVPEAFFE